MPIFLPAGINLMSVGDTILSATADVTRILQFIPQPKEVGDLAYPIFL